MNENDLKWEFQVHTMRGAVEILRQEPTIEPVEKSSLPDFTKSCELCGKRFIAHNGYLSCNCRKFKI